MKVNVISESGIAPGQGVDSAFRDTVSELKTYGGADVAANSGRRADIIHAHTVGPYCLWRIARRRGAGVVVSAHVTPDSFVGSLVGAKYWYGLAKAYLRWFYNLADAVLAVSGETLAEVKKMGVTKPLYLVPNTIQADEFANSPEQRRAARKRLGMADDAFVVIAVGQVQPRKRVDTFAEAAKSLPQAQFVWIGGMQFKALAADSADMKRMMNGHQPNLKFPGILPRAQVAEYLKSADLFFLPSEQETFGLVIVEAAAAGLPVLLRDLPQYRDTFAGGYESGGDGDFARIIKRFIQDADYYQKWQKAAQTIVDRYGAREGAKRLMTVYEEVLAAKRRQ